MPDPNVVLERNCGDYGLRRAFLRTAGGFYFRLARAMLRGPLFLSKTIACDTLFTCFLLTVFVLRSYIRMTAMFNKLTCLCVLVLALGLAAGQAVGGVSYSDPPGGWRYIYPGVGAANPDAAALDGNWDHNNGSDAWDGSLIGAGQAGGIIALSDGGVSFLRIQDALTSGGGTDSRKIYFGHSLTAIPNPMPQATADQILSVEGVTLSFRARLATTPPLDGTVPAGGDGYVIHDGGKGPFGVHQEAGGDKTISFGLVRAGDTNGEPKIEIVDLHSKHGVFLNDEKIVPGNPRELNPGDIIQLGSIISFQFTRDQGFCLLKNITQEIKRGNLLWMDKNQVKELPDKETVIILLKKPLYLSLSSFGAGEDTALMIDEEGDLEIKGGPEHTRVNGDIIL